MQDGGVTLAELAPARATALYSALPTVLTVYMQDRQTGEKTTLAGYTLSDLEAMATKSTAGYQYVGMKGWAVMAATEYVTIDCLLAGEALGTGDTLVVTADDASYSVTFDDLEENTYFFLNSKSNTDKKADGKQIVPAMVALTWNTGKIETEPDSAALQNELDEHAAIYQLTATCGGKAVTTLNGTAQLKLPYTLQTDELAANVRTSIRSGDTCTALTASYADGYATFTMTVLSRFAVGVPGKRSSVTISLTPTVSGGKASASVDADEAKKALEDLKDGGKLILDATTSKAISASEVTLPKSTLESLVK